MNDDSLQYLEYVRSVYSSTDGNDLCAMFSDEHFMFKLRSTTAIIGYYGPVIIPGVHLSASLHYNGLDSEHHARSQWQLEVVDVVHDEW